MDSEASSSPKPPLVVTTRKPCLSTAGRSGDFLSFFVNTLIESRADGRGMYRSRQHYGLGPGKMTKVPPAPGTHHSLHFSVTPSSAEALTVDKDWLISVATVSYDDDQEQQ